MLSLPVYKKVFWVILLPLAHLWGGLTILRRRFLFRRSNRVQRGVPQTIVVGNIHSGGSGKTPIVISIAEKLGQQGLAIISRGYRSEKESLGALVNTAQTNGCKVYGDEPFLLANRLKVPVFVGKDRLHSLLEASAQFQTTVAILDDGFQNFSIPNRFDVVVVSAEKNPMASFLLPLGELREPLSALEDAGAIVLTPGRFEEEWKPYLSGFNVPFFLAERVIDGVFGEMGELKDEVSFGLFSGIASPERFYRDALSISPQSQILRSFRDHHEYSTRDLGWLTEQRHQQKLNFFLTTEKDYPKVQTPLKERGEKVFYLKIRYNLPESFHQLIERHRVNAA